MRPVWPAAAVLATATVAAWLGPPLRGDLIGLRSFGPAAVLIVAAAMAWWFNRGRTFVIVASLLAAFAAYEVFQTRAVYTALTVLVPVNALLVLAYPERGARYRAAYRWLALIAGEALLVLWIGAAGRSAFSGTVWNDLLDNFLLRSPPTPLIGRLAFAAAFAAAAWRAWPDHTPLQVGNAAALIAFFIAAEWIGSASVYPAFMTAAGAVLIVALLQESHSLAFRDQLTGLPGRRSLEERLRTLKPPYTIAMVDVDHFKKFNDTHGHAIGDQVLKLVAARLAQVGGGGIAYRYGGEEFSVLFPGRTLEQAWPHLEAIRAAIEGYRMAVRGADRPKNAEDGALRRGARAPMQTLSVTVSVGGAQRSETLPTPALVIHAADEALYRAKQAGRNRLSR